MKICESLFYEDCNLMFIFIISESLDLLFLSAVKFKKDRR